MQNQEKENQMGHSRVLKFRAWDKEEKRFLRGWEFVISSIGQCEELVGETYMSTDRSRKFILMQFTGLKDKNGKEIYEEDVLQDMSGNKDLVVWEDGSFLVKHSETNYDFIAKRNHFEIIGNIYENPDLIK